MIEQHIEFVKGDSPVHLPQLFVAHYQDRDDGVLSIIAAIVTLPILLADGVMLDGEALDRKRGVYFEMEITSTSQSNNPTSRKV